MNPELEYDQISALSQSGMKSMAVSPLRYWHEFVNPNRKPKAPTPEQALGTALHCAVLQPHEFDRRYACEVDASDFRDCLVTMDELRAWLREHGMTPRGTRKNDVIAQVMTHSEHPPILDVELERHQQRHAGKIILSKDDWFRVGGMSQALREEPALQKILAAPGEPEKIFHMEDPETKCPLKARMDWVLPNLTLDLKSFTARRGKSVNRSVADAILYEGYYHQAYFYTFLRTLTEKKEHDFILAFIESEEPWEVRLRLLRSRTGGNANVYWTRAMIETRGHCRTYVECMERFGEQPWRYAQTITPLADEEMQGLAW